MDQTYAEAEVVHAMRPRQRVGQLGLVTIEVGESRLSSGERHRPSACVAGREGLSFPARDRVAIQVGNSRLIEKIRVEDPRVIGLTRPCPPRVPARDAWCE